MKNNRYTNWFFAAAVVVAGFSMAACEDEPDKYEVAGIRFVWSVRICGVFTSSISMTRRRYLIPVTSLTIHLW